jgi:hypothetical protein
MRITIHTLAYTESVLLPYFISWYQERFPASKIVVHDAGSTDDTETIASRAGCDVVPFQLDELYEPAITEYKNSVWKDDKTEWSLVADVDELLQFNYLDLQFEHNRGSTLIRSIGWDMVSTCDDEPIGIIAHGVRNTMEDKFVLFRRGAIQEMRYCHGAHWCSPVGRVAPSFCTPFLYHYKYLSVPWVIERTRYTRARLSQANLDNGWGVQALRTDDEIKALFEVLRRKAVEIR